ncbi:polyprenyl synthetase family protein [Agromyces sp. Marseille-P2726]|uniref:polyprenyl synthetase family protein n=1 Tax=Agromyces sp. Marseille-P2726 TaxID=2709132 RepID=UPI00156E30CC|nr:polyprenyl synthetase family protein [Agromyces sp. Marseille-P2726]
MTDLLTSTVDDGLRTLFAETLIRSRRYGDHYTRLWESLEQQMAGGKRIRPHLVNCAYEGFGGADQALVTRVAIAFELLHTAFIIHDDVIDGDVVRRGRPTIAARFAQRGRAGGVDPRRSREWGETAAVLAGDLALSLAPRELALLPIPEARRAALLDVLDRAVFVSAAGELADVVTAGSMAAQPMELVLATLEHKTAVYSFECPLTAGAILAGAPDDSVEALARFGRLVGVAFQITDDILGVFGDPAVTGKSTTSDLRSGKQTALTAHAATTDAWPFISTRLGDPALDDEGADSVRAALLDCGALDAARRLADEHVALARFELDAAELPDALKVTLAELAERAAERSR